jgi:hypothetical protein
MSKHIIRPSVRWPVSCAAGATADAQSAHAEKQAAHTHFGSLSASTSQPHTDGTNGLLSTQRLARLVHAFAPVLLRRSRVNNEWFDFHLGAALRKWTKFAKHKK